MPNPQSDPPTDEPVSELQRFYEATVVMGEEQTDTTITDAQREMLERAELVMAHRSGPVRRVLDLGCGAGSNTLALFGSRADIEVMGVDISRTAVDTYQRRTGRAAQVGVGERLPFETGSFDLIVCNDVIEHVVDTDTFTEEIRRVLRPGAHLLLSTPNLAAWFNRLALLVGIQPAFSEVSQRRVFGRPGSDVVGHLRLFTPRALDQFLRYHHLQPLDTRGVGFHSLAHTPLGWLDRFAARWVDLAGITIVLAQTPPMGTAGTGEQSEEGSVPQETGGRSPLVQ